MSSDSFMSNNLPNTINNFVEDPLVNKYMSTFIIIFFVSYGSFLGSGGKPPPFVISLFSNPITRILLLALIWKIILKYCALQ